uniref:Protein RETICULATA-related 1, chloroplastic n=1 Tax=Vitis vinifera TaxID=29760 RepID=A5C6S3_VITVI|nr:hypothetical protein VITISV_031174 [Vitis vinifera]
MSVFSSSFRFLHLSDSQHDVAFTNQCSGSSAITKSPNLHFTNALHVPASSHSLTRNQVLVTRCAGAESPAKPVTDVEASFAPKIEDNNSGDSGDGSDGSDFGGSGSGGGGGGGDGGEDNSGEEEFGRILKFEEVMREAENRGASLPSDMWEAAKTTGIREVILFRYLDLQGSVWPLGFGMKHFSMLRNRMLADPSFLFKVGTEKLMQKCNSSSSLSELQMTFGIVWHGYTVLPQISCKMLIVQAMGCDKYAENATKSWVNHHCNLYYGQNSCDGQTIVLNDTAYFIDYLQVVIDSCCATFAEVQKRGKDFWAEFELYAADLLVGVVVDIALVGMLAPYTRFGQPSISRGLVGRIQHACAALPKKKVRHVVDYLVRERKVEHVAEKGT